MPWLISVRFPALALVCAGALGCQAPSAIPALPRQWIEVGLGPVQHDEAREPPLEDDFGYSLGGGWDFVSAEHLRAGLDLGFGWGHYDVEVPASSSEDPDLNAWTWLVGVRLQADARPVPFGAHVRAGGAKV